MFWLKTTPQSPLTTVLWGEDSVMFQIESLIGCHSWTFFFDSWTKRAWKSSGSLFSQSRRQQLIIVTIERLAHLLPWRGETWSERGSPGSHWAVRGLIRVTEQQIWIWSGDWGGRLLVETREEMWDWGWGAEEIAMFVTKTCHFPPLWMQVTLCPGLWTANENVTALSFRKCSSARRKEKEEVKLTECKWLAGVGMEMKWMADEVFLLPSQKHSAQEWPKLWEVRLPIAARRALPQFSPPLLLFLSFLFSLLCPTISPPPRHHWDGSSKSNRGKKILSKRSVAFSAFPRRFRSNEAIIHPAGILHKFDIKQLDWDIIIFQWVCSV